MQAIERLRRDHTILRAKLNVLESALTMGPETWFVLREVCHSLAHQLRDHIRREETLVTACRQAIRHETLAQMAVEHQDEPQHLRTINRLFIEAKGHGLEEVRPTLTRLIEDLRRHMAEEEVALFPVLEQILASREPAVPSIPAHPTSRLHEVMTVNRVVRQYPSTRRLFEQLFVNVAFEGCDCLDEVAWRHGMESPELLAKLEGVIEAEEQPTGSSNRLLTEVSCECHEHTTP